MKTYESIFELGDKVYRISRNLLHKKDNCEACDGTGKVTIKSKEYDCPDCNGRGCHTNECWDNWHVDEDCGYVNAITIKSQLKNKEMKYTHSFGCNSISDDDYGYSFTISDHMNLKDGGCGWIIDQENVFKSYEEAQSECDKRNKKL